MSVAMDDIQSHLSELESVWDSGMGDAYAFYRPRATPAVALAAAMVESALALQELGDRAPDPPHLLLGDLCLARASRLLAATRDQRLQICFARAVEHVAAAAAGGPAAPPLRTLLVAAIGEAG
ncbi:MAG TPA: hypothetical protein VOB72_03025 [Candidatus Dormibacteraeota bacterium]|nr:hypothetical protein [Candidatus Dormibacteraeota bacterium]